VKAGVSGSLAYLYCKTEIQLKDTDWQFDDELELLRDDIKLIADQCRADETKKMVNAIEVSSPTFDRRKVTHSSSMPFLEKPQETTRRAGRNRPRKAKRRHVGRFALSVQEDAGDLRGTLSSQGEK
jgi:hypothetical protein